MRIMRISSTSLAAFVVLLLVFSMGCSDGDGGTADVATSGAGATDVEDVDAGRGELAEYKDPGAGEWELGTPEYCKMDPTMFNDDSAIDRYAVFRYGKLCYIKGDDTPVPIYSVTKTLGAVMAGRASFMAREVERTGPGTGPILHTDLGSDWIAEPKYSHPETTINHIMAMVALSPSLADADLLFQYDAMGNGAINGMIEATEKCAGQVPGLPRDAATFVQQEIFDRMGMTNSAWDPTMPISPTDSTVLESIDPEILATLNPSGGIGIGLTANLSDMGKFGTLLLHDGWYGGERLLSQEWVYRMSHPAFESASTSYGQLTWLNHRGNAVPPTFGAVKVPKDGTGTYAFFYEGNPCAPAAFWPRYPHPPSDALDCRATAAGASCSQQYDVGVYFAWGGADDSGGQIEMHPALDMVIVSQYVTSDIAESGELEPARVWDVVRPGVVAMDPTYQGDEEAFCRDYGAGNYAPDLVAPRWKTSAAPEGGAEGASGTGGNGGGDSATDYIEPDSGIPGGEADAAPEGGADGASGTIGGDGGDGATGNIKSGGGIPGDPVIEDVAEGCPVFESGTIAFMGLEGIALEVGLKAADPTAPMLFYWHAMLSTSDEHAEMAGAVSQGVVDEGGVVVSFQDSSGEGDGMCSGTSTFFTGDFDIADQLVACAVRDHNVDPRRIFTTGCSAGALFAACMAAHRSSYIAAAATNSGGFFEEQPFDSDYTPALMTIHGGDGDVMFVDFREVSKNADEHFRDRGGFVIDCDHGGGHAGGAALAPDIWEFFRAHPYGVVPEPWASGLPDSFSSNCAIY